MHILHHRSRLCGFYVTAAALSMYNGVDLSGNRYDVDSLASCVSDAVRNRCKDAIVPLRNVGAAEFCVIVRPRLHCVCHSAGTDAAVCTVRLPVSMRYVSSDHTGCERNQSIQSTRRLSSQSSRVRIKRMVGLHNCL